MTAPASNATNASLSSSGPTIGLIVVSILLVLSLACAILLGLLALRLVLIPTKPCSAFSSGLQVPSQVEVP